jgi:hypothetical protein
MPLASIHEVKAVNCWDRAPPAVVDEPAAVVAEVDDEVLAELPPQADKPRAAITTTRARPGVRRVRTPRGRGKPITLATVNAGV